MRSAQLERVSTFMPHGEQKQAKVAFRNTQSSTCTTRWPKGTLAYWILDCPGRFDTTTALGGLQVELLGLAEFELELIRERVAVSLDRAKKGRETYRRRFLKSQDGYSVRSAALSALTA